VLSIVELKATALDYGIPGVSPTLMLLLVVLMFSVPMIPYLFLYLSLRDRPGRASTAIQKRFTTKAARLESLSPRRP
jgi:hypothetical protein